MLARLYEEMERLPESFRAPLVLHYFQGLSTETIAQRLGCRRGTVLSRLARARSEAEKTAGQPGLSSGFRPGPPRHPTFSTASIGYGSAPAPARDDPSRGQPGTGRLHTIQSVASLTVASLSASKPERTGPVPGTQGGP